MTADDITYIRSKLDTIAGHTSSIDTRLSIVETRLEYLPTDDDVTEEVNTKVAAAVEACAASRASQPPSRRWGLDDRTIGLIKWVVGAVIFATGGGAIGHLAF